VDEMNILFLSDNFPPEVSAAASRVYERACYWVQEKHRVSVITSAPNFPWGKLYDGYKNSWVQKEQMDNINVIRVKTFMAPNKGFFLRTVDFISYMIMAVIVGSFQQKPDVIIATSPQFFAAVGGWALSKIKRVPFIFEISDLWPESIKGLGLMGDSFVYRSLEKLELFLYRQSRLIIVQTNAFKENLVARGINPLKIKIISNAVDIKKYKPVTQKNKKIMSDHGLENKFVIGYIGTHGMSQNLKNVVDVAKRVGEASKHVVFLFVGDGAERDEVMQYAAAHNLKNTVFIPQQCKSDIPEWWSVCDVALVHLKDLEVFKTVIPSKIYEAAGMGLPVLLVAPEGEASQLVEREKLGIHVPVDDKEAFIKQVINLSTSETWKEVFSFSLPIAAQTYNREKQAQDFINCISQI
jgi:colanic acid biosynthesis glycosyl transferase WcaI